MKKNLSTGLTIAIDGYSSSGKNTIARAVAKLLKYRYIDSGAMYRAVTLFCIENNIIDPEGLVNKDSLAENMNKIEINFITNNKLNKEETYLNNINVEEKIRSMEVSDHVSEISKYGIVREKLVNLQQKMGENKRVVMDGRDIGTVVFPNADLKIFVTADVEIRAKRRFKELQEKGATASLFEVSENVKKRDIIDANRELSPLLQADDAIVLDNSNMTPAEQLEWVMDLITEKFGKQMC